MERFTIMKKILVFLIIFCISTFFGVHTYEHTKINMYTDEYHSSSFNDHAHLENNYNTFDTHEGHHPSLHKHLDNLFVRSARQREGDDKLFIPQIFVNQKAFLSLPQLAVFKNPKTSISTISYNTPFVSSNQPLLI